MEYPNSYLRWIEYLKRRKLYGSWFKDIATFVDSNIDREIISKEARKIYEPMYDRGGGWYINFNFNASLYTSEEIEGLQSRSLSNKQRIENYLFSIFNGSNGITKSYLITLTSSLNSIRHKYRISGIYWYKIYEEYREKFNPILSKGLTRKLNRSNSRESWSGGYKEKVDQPWYSKSYEKYNRKAWKK